MTPDLLYNLVFAFGFLVGFMAEICEPAPRIIDGMYLRPRGGWR